MAEAAYAGALTEAGVASRLLHAAAAGPEDLLAADGYLFAAPENLGSLAGVMKDFFDRCYYPVLDRLNGRPYGSMVCAGSDGQGGGAADGTHRHRLAAARDGGSADRLYSRAEQCCDHGAKTIMAEDRARCRELGAALAVGLALGVF